MHTVRSADGTTIALEQAGTGPALVLVTGAFCDRASPASLVAALRDRFTVHVYDRRGRGSSGDVPPYSTDREIEDLGAVIEAAGGAASVYGHSSGGRLALDAAAAGLPITRLAVYEPPFRPGAPGVPPAWPAQVQRLLDEGDRRGAATLHLRESGTPEQVVQSMQQAPWWPAMEALAHTLPYDEALCGDLAVPDGRLATVAVPTLVLAGGDSDPGWRSALRAVAEAVPKASYAQLPGQGHVPSDTALVPVLVEFLRPRA
jgi:pimeloyl-ACP methyl ester carboxylesterase